MDPESPSPGRMRRFLLEPGGDHLREEDLHHALRVNRLQPGDRFLGLDGQGRAWPLRVTAVGRRDLAYERDGEPIEQAPPGQPGSPVGWLEVAVSLPKAVKWESMVDRLTQLGVARLQPLFCRHSPPSATAWSPSRRGKLERTVAEAMKQSGRLWPMEVADPLELEPWWQAAPEASALLHPGPGGLLGEALARNPGSLSRLAVGPEGGFAPEEAAGRRCLALRGHILRTETAAELAAGLFLQTQTPPAGSH
ncbi:MAG: RsmE family RNA methyltransferase [Planctomycetota bacterium]